MLQRLRSVDCDSLSAVDDKELRKTWRGETIPGGAHVKPVVRRHRPTSTTLPTSIDLADEATGSDPDRTISSSSTARGDEDDPQITEVATKIDRNTNRGVQGHAVKDFRSSKRSCDSTILPPHPKRHQPNQSQMKYERPPQPVALLDDMARKCLIIEGKPPMTRQSSNVNTNRQYTFNDYSCGAGGMSRAAY